MQISMQRVSGRVLPVYEFTVIPSNPEQQYVLELEFERAEISWADASKNCEQSGRGFGRISLSCTGDAVLKVRVFIDRDNPKARFTMPSQPDFRKEFNVGRRK